jgi:hypothetical protein
MKWLTLEENRPTAVYVNQMVVIDRRRSHPMSILTTSVSMTAEAPEATPGQVRPRPVVWRAGLVAGVIASVATASIALLARGVGAGTRLTLALTHVVAAAIIVPPLARRLAR